ncbi:MAG: ABC-F family ATP-binding cassette domain-containing protein [Verrucomicrobia bacterium]|nr:ABC-F family ATP-binding cassette domain-containing protein [Verrucomicrobiota bacterium]
MSPIQFKNVSLSFLEKTCFEKFNASINFGNRIALIGRNGSGKSTLLKMLRGSVEPSSGTIQIPGNMVVGYVPQIIESFESRSGGERLIQALEESLELDPQLLLLDEPTNHLDRQHRKYLFRLLQDYDGTLLIASHDPELLRHCVDTLWHLHDEKITIFSGSYDDYLCETAIQREHIECELGRIDREQKATHHALMKEQERASKRKAHGGKKYAGDKLALRAAQGKGEMTHNKNKKAIRATRDDLLEQLSELYLPEIIVPKFSLTSEEIEDRIMISISAGSIAYEKEKMILSDIYFSLHSKGRIALLGKNGSGKSTLVKALLGDEAVIKSGDWYVPKSKEIGYLDQHYSTLPLQQTVLESLSKLVPWPHSELRRHLNNFLFRKNEEVHRPIYQLSGGEKARLSLAHIAAKTPRLLILDEVTNNLDLETRQHVINVLQTYPGAIIVISHDEEFLDEINIEESYDVSEWV